MTNAKRDENGVHTAIAVSSADGITIDLVKVNPSGNRLQVSSGTTGTDKGTQNAKRDENNVPCLMGTSSEDGITPIAIYTDGNGRLLTQST